MQNLWLGYILHTLPATIILFKQIQDYNIQHIHWAGWVVGRQETKDWEAADKEEVMKNMPKSWEEEWFCGSDIIFLCVVVEIIQALYTLFP